MIRFLITIGFFLVVGILVYNRFFGTDAEKEQAKEIFRKTGDLLKDTWNLLRSEKEKLDAGKYDHALEQLGQAYQSLRQGAKYLDENMLRRLGELERRKAALEQELSNLEGAEQALRDSPPLAPKKGRRGSLSDDVNARKAELERQRQAIEKELEQLMRDSEALVRQVQQQ
ncbi:MAG: hypothetical protein RMJ33_11115 [Saprospiraceae bacterium]|nr:hypothetical protein [Saprospiraceae bacterium]MDW8230377.1 hypothetical protein [Saprospiraceae bacterium]